MDPMDASSYLIPDWLEQCIEDSKDEVCNDDPSWPVKLLGMSCRKLVWNLCGTLGVHKKGIPGQVCRLVERYLATRFRAISISNGSLEEWNQLRLSMVVRMPLLIASAIQISGKLFTVANQLRPSIIQKVLKIKGMPYTIQEITEAEFDFFKTLNYRMPLWTSVETAELLATELGMPPEMLPGVSAIVDLAEFNRFNIEDDLAHTATGSTETVTRKQLRTLDLCAGSVAAAARHLNFQGPDPALRLSSMIRTPSLYIACVSNLILKHIQEDHSEPLILKKRKIY